MSKVWNRDEIIEKINSVLPEGKVIPRHTAQGHFYEVLDEVYIGDPRDTIYGPVYPSVTGKLQVLKDEGLINYKMNRAVEFFGNFLFSLTHLPTMEEIGQAKELAANSFPKFPRKWPQVYHF